MIELQEEHIKTCRVRFKNKLPMFVFLTLVSLVIIFHFSSLHYNNRLRLVEFDFIINSELSLVTSPSVAFLILALLSHLRASQTWKTLSLVNSLGSNDIWGSQLSDL